ncbi:MAG: hypothetical protein JSV11_10730 [Nitrospiraceae bacterium]|nr:MAG: hypothetical protein JSV11_10730 [Nitrospiraceae bacterium]
MNVFKRLAKGFERIMVAVTYAEAGEFETAKESMREKNDYKKTDLKQGRKTLQPLSAH